MAHINIARRNVFLLALCQALFITGNTVFFSVAGLIGQSLAPSKVLTTLPFALMQLGNMLATIPASILMKRVGRRWGFMAGVFIGIGGASLGVGAIASRSFWALCGSTILLGIYSGFSGYYRFAAVEVAPKAWRSQAISLVISGGILTVLIGPPLASWSKDLFPGVIFGGSFVTMIVLMILTLGVLGLTHMPKIISTEQQETGRGLGVIIRQPVFIVAVTGSTLGFGAMILILTAALLEIIAQGYPFETAAIALQCNILGLFGTSFFTGRLITRFGVLKIMAAGAILALLCIAINLLTSNYWSYMIALAFLGVSWSFLYIGSTALLTEAYQPIEKAKTQAAHDFISEGLVTIPILLSGALFQTFGWAVVNWAALPMAAIVLVAVLWFQQQSTIDHQRLQ